MDSMEIAKFGVAVTTIVKPLVEAFISPKLKEMAETKKFQDKLDSYKLEEHFTEYLGNAVEHHSILKTIVFSNEPKSIDELYIPLTMLKSESNNKNEEKYVMDSFKEELFAKYNKVLITDTAGMGKTTTLKWLFVSCCKLNRGYPIFIDLRRLSNEKSILSEIINQLNLINKNFDEDVLKELVARGDFVFFFDGYDEIPYDFRENVTKDISDFISKSGNNIFVMSSRPNPDLSSFEGFQSFQLLPLEVEQSKELILKYDCTKDKEVATLLLKELEVNIKNEELYEFLKNPLLTTLMFLTYNHQKTLADKMHIFYSNVYDALYFKHDSHKGDAYKRQKRTNLKTDDFHRVLRCIGYYTLPESKSEYENDAILLIIDKVKNECTDLNFTSSDFLEDLISSVPLFTLDGLYYKWCHKSMQEYFFASYIWKDAKENQSNILISIYKSVRIENYGNMLKLYYDMDYLGFRNNIILTMINEYISYYEMMICNLNEIKMSEEVIYMKYISDAAFCFYKKQNELDSEEININDAREKAFGMSRFDGRFKAATGRMLETKNKIGFCALRFKSEIHNCKMIINLMQNNGNDEILIKIPKTNLSYDIIDEISEYLSDYIQDKEEGFVYSIDNNNISEENIEIFEKLFNYLNTRDGFFEHKYYIKYEIACKVRDEIQSYLEEMKLRKIVF